MSIYYSNPKTFLINYTKVMSGILRGYLGGGGGVGVKGWGNGAKLYQETSCFDTNLREW